MDIVIKTEYLDNIILFNRREIQLRFLEKESYSELFKLAPEYFDVKEEIKSRRWSDIFEDTPLFKISKKN